MELKDYIQYYIGCKVQHEFITKTKNIELRYGILMGLHTSEIINRCYLQFDSYSDSVRFDSIKPILRKPESLTMDEMKECGNLVYDFSNEPDLNTWHWSNFEAGLCAEQIDWLLKRGFDLFNLIENELAIDSKTLK